MTEKQIIEILQRKSVTLKEQYRNWSVTAVREESYKEVAKAILELTKNTEVVYSKLENNVMIEYTDDYINS